MTAILSGNWPPERIAKAARRYEILRRIPPYLHVQIWNHTLQRGCLDDLVDAIGDRMEADGNRLLAEIVAEVLEKSGDWTRLTIENNRDGAVSVLVRRIDLNLGEVVEELIRPALLGAGYCESTVDLLFVRDRADA